MRNWHEDLSFRDLLQQVRQVTLDAYENQEAPFEKLVQELQPQRDMGHTPLFQVMFALQNYEQGDLKLSGLEVTNYQYCANANAKFDLSLVIVESETELRGEVEYSTDLFDADTIANMVRSFKTLASEVAEAGNGKISQLSLTDEAEHAGWSSPAEWKLKAERFCHRLHNMSCNHPMHLRWRFLEQILPMVS